MKKHQIAAMLLSALSAGVLISCSKPAEDSATDAVTNKADSPSTAVKSETKNVDSAAQSSTKVAAITPLNIAPETELKYLNHVAADYIVPTYQNAAKQSNTLNQLANKACQSENLNAETLEALRSQWLEVAKAWAQAEAINFGPAMDSMSNLYINYYPDERGMVHQGVLDLISANPNLTADQLAAESAIVQGIPGLEEVLFSNSTLNAAQCRYVASASEALANRLNKVSKTWTSDSAVLLGIDGENKAAATLLGMNQWINSLLALVEMTKTGAIDQPLGLTGSKKGHVPAAAAGQSRAILDAKLTVLNQALTDPQLVAMLAENGQDTLSDNIAGELSDASATLSQMPTDISKAQPEQQQALYDDLTDLTRLIKRQLMPLFSVQVGFNNTDGD